MMPTALKPSVESPSIEARFERLEIELDLFIARKRMWKRAQIHADLEFAEIKIQKAFNILEHPEGAEVHSIVASSRIQLLIKRLERAKQTIYAHA